MENGWKMENAHRMGHRQVCCSSGILLFRSAHLHEHKDQMPALRIASCTYTLDGWLQVLLCSPRLEWRLLKELRPWTICQEEPIDLSG